MSWLPKRPASPDLAGLPPWWPSPVEAVFGPRQTEARKLAYLLVDELDNEVVGLVVTRWPRVDEHGRVVFEDPDEAEEVAVPRDALQALLGERRVVAPAARAVEAVRTRPIAIGDVLAAHVEAVPSADEESVPESIAPGDWIKGPILDLTAEGVELARMQASAAATGVLGEEFLEQVAAELLDEEPPEPGPPARRGMPRGSGGGSSTGGDASTARRRAPVRTPRDVPPAEAEGTV